MQNKIQNKISFISFKNIAKGIIDLLHNKPAAEVDLIKAETDAKRADTKLKEAKSNYINAKTQEAHVQKYSSFDQLLERMGIPKEKRQELILRENSRFQKAIYEIHSLHEKKRILSIQLEDKETG